MKGSLRGWWRSSLGRTKPEEERGEDELWCEVSIGHVEMAGSVTAPSSKISAA
jgi:hypothetical protein